MSNVNLMQKRILKGYIPGECEKQTFEGLEGVLICRWFDGNNNPCAAAYSGRKIKPDFCFSFITTKRREERIDTYLESIKTRYEEKKKTDEEKMNFVHEYKKGDILYSSWGYEQTNIDFYQVVDVPTNKSVIIRQLKEHRKENSIGMTGETIPLINQFYGEKMLRRVSLGGVVKVNECEQATMWNGKPKSYTSYY